MNPNMPPAEDGHRIEAPAPPEDPNYQIFPDSSPEEERVLRESIKQQGVLNAVVKDEQGNIVEGHRRQRIADELGKPCPDVVHHFKSEAEKFQFALISNCARRSHLNQRQKRQVIARYLRGDAEISNNWLAETLGVSDTTVIGVRKELESTSQIGKFKKLRGKDGKKRPAKNKATGGKPKKGKVAKHKDTGKHVSDEPPTIQPVPEPPMPDDPSNIDTEGTVLDRFIQLGIEVRKLLGDEALDRAVEQIKAHAPETFEEAFVEV